MTQIESVKRNKYIIELAKENHTAEEIANIVGIKRYRVLQILRAYKVKAARPVHRLECTKAQNIIKELKKGTKEIEIAKRLCVSRQYVNQVKKSYTKLEHTNEN